MTKVCNKCGKVINRESSEYIFTLCENEGLNPCKLTTKIDNFDLPVPKIEAELIPPGFTPEGWDKKKKDKVLKKKLKTITKKSSEKTKQEQFEWQIKKQVQIEVKKEVSYFHNKVLVDIRKLQDEVLKAKHEYFQQASKIFDSPKFWEGFNKQMVGWIDRTIDSKIRDADYHRLVSESLKSKMKDELGFVIREVVENVMVNINKKFTNEYETTRQLCYSIDAEIRHTLLKAPISAQESGIINKKIHNVLDESMKQFAKKQLEDKKNGR